MDRRYFLISAGLFTILFGAKIQETQKSKLFSLFESLIPTIEAVQNHLFPQGGKIPSAKEMNAIGFLKETLLHRSFDRDTRDFVIEGAKELIARTDGKFVAMDENQKERALRAYEETDYGSSWLHRIMILTMEALFGDPLYGSNIHQSGWRAIGIFGGEPRPTSRYCQI